VDLLVYNYITANNEDTDMARPREFDIDDALIRAMNVFWAHGYDAASLPVLLDGMGLTRGSLYKAFVDKKNLFLKVLNKYEVEAVKPATALLTTGPVDGLERIRMLFNGVVDVVRNGDHRGCLLCSAAAGAAAVDADIAEIVHHQLDQMQDAFYVALSQSTTYAGASDQDRRETANLLLSQYVGLRVLVRSNASAQTLEKSVSAMNRLISLTPS
jgi:TetR/AcrR family transcriptional repressor of nem operon